MALADRTLWLENKIGGVRTAPSSTPTVAVIRTDTLATVIATTNMTLVSTGLYKYVSTGQPFDTTLTYRATFTVVNTVGTVTHTEDFTVTASAVASGASTAHAGFLTTTIRRLRTMVDEPDLDAKYPSSYLIADVIEPAMAQVWDDLGLTSSAQIKATIDIALTANTPSYVLPPCVGRLWRIFTANSTTGMPLREAIPRSHYNESGYNYEIYGNVLHFRPAPSEAVTVKAEFTPVVDMRLHKGTGTRNVSDATKITLDGDPTQGSLDNRPNAYVGAMLRVLDDGSSPITEQERVITAYDSSTRVATVSNAFSPALGSGTITYEIAPICGPALYNVIAMRAALTMLASKGGSESRYRKVMAEYQAGIRLARSTMTNMEARVGRRFEADVNDHPDKWPWMRGPALVSSVVAN